MSEPEPTDALLERAINITLILYIRTRDSRYAAIQDQLIALRSPERLAAMQAELDLIYASAPRSHL